VAAETPLLDERWPGKAETRAFAELKQGLVGGVKPLPIAIPESGKLLLLSGVLPPEKIGVEIEVKGNKEKRGWF